MAEKTQNPEVAALLAKVAELEAKTKAAEDKAKVAEDKAKAFGSTFALKVSDKGCVTMQGPGIRRFGVTLYATEWLAALAGIGVSDSGMHTFIRENRAKLAWKGTASV